MKSSYLFPVFLILFSYTSSIICHTPSTNPKLSIYIIHVERPEDDNIYSDDDLESWHRSFLPRSYSDSEDSDRLLYSYSEAFPGFAAALTEDELKGISKKDGFIRAYPDRTIPLLTTHSPSFLGLQRQSGLWKNSNLGKGVIVGVLDTGILPGHPSFNENGVPPPPKRWKGRCNFRSGCNNKIIGARSYGYSRSHGPIDEVGHGSHTASTIAGNFISNINPFGLANGTMSGMAPHAHLAIYQVCSAMGCSTSDIIAGMDDAIKDGVDIMSLSLGGRSMPYSMDPIAMGAYKANEKGITVVCAGGNSGPAARTLWNEAPWILTVAASTMDRSFRTSIKLDNGGIVLGESLIQPSKFSPTPLPLYKGSCSSLADVRGKVLVCPLEIVKRPTLIFAAKNSGAAGMIVVGQEKYGHTILPEEVLILPGAFVTYEDGMKIKGASTVSFAFNHTVLGVSPAPVIAHFSSRGPSIQSPGILKPDISAPGVNIIAAWHTRADKGSQVPLKVVSGTSMATPHVSGVAALIKSVHPDWSPAAIRSALITSSDFVGKDGRRIKDEKFNDASFYASGAGHMNPSKAVSQGLVYETEVKNYIAYLCQSVGTSGVSAIVGKRTSCSNVAKVKDSELNYPTITVGLSSKATTVKRTVTNVGDANATYKVKVDVPEGVTVSVEPDTLQFSKKKEKKTFTVSVSASHAAEGNLMWISGEMVVRSALVVTN